MKIVHYIPSIDRTAGGTSTYMQVLAKGLGELAEGISLHMPRRTRWRWRIVRCIMYRSIIPLKGLGGREWLR